MRFYSIAEAIRLRIAAQPSAGALVTVTRALRGLTLMLSAAVLVTGCVSQPVDIASRSPSEMPVSAQEDLRTAVAAFRMRQEEAGGWTLGADGSARGLLGRLVGGAPERSDAAGDYIRQAGDALPSYLAGDIVLASDLADDVSQAALVVASTSTPLPESQLVRDIASVETVLASARRARTFFQAVSVDDRAGLTSNQRVTLSEALSRLDDSISALVNAADALADRRWAASNALAS
ncbi:MAG TPA: hypothetical protein DF715_05830 [Oceanicaulis sp.]|jgi:hypothetical protein|nr:hypothetical protein [Synechococcus moorigangaii CMS01]HCY55050.1 hypothetical protein [Oceanicaulis sp.]